MPRRGTWAEVERQVANSNRWLWATFAFLIDGILAALLLNTGVNGILRTAFIAVLVVCLVGALLAGLVYQWKWTRTSRSIRKERKARQSKADTKSEPHER